MPYSSIGFDLGEAAEPRDPDAPVAQRRGDHLVEHAGLAQRIDVRVLELLAAKVRTAGVERIDQRDVAAGAAEHRRGERACQPRAHDGDLGFPHLWPRIVRRTTLKADAYAWV